MKNKFSKYLVICCLLSACLVLFNHTGIFTGVLRKNCYTYEIPVNMAQKAFQEKTVNPSETNDAKQAVKEKRKTVNEKGKTVNEEEKTIKERKKTVNEEEKTIKEKKKTVNEEEKAIKEGEKTVNKEKKTVRQEKKAAQTASSIPQVRLNDADYECLLKIVQSEAGICDQKGKILVANVILNRMKNQDFPDTVTAVVYQKNQFSPVENGAIDRVCITEETKEAVSMALSGTDYSKGALFFAARKLAGRENMKWFDESLEFLFEHDGHEFFTLKTNIQS